jgi:O-antigen ligase
MTTQEEEKGMAANSTWMSSRRGDMPVRRPVWVAVAGALLALGSGVLMGLLGGRAIVPLFLLLFGVIVGTLFLVERYDALAVLAVVIAILVDWFPFPGIYSLIYHPNFALLFAALVLVIMFLRQSRARPWIGPPAFGWWLLLLALGVYPTLSALSLVEGGKYYADVLLSAVVLYVLGVQVATNARAVRRVFGMLSGVAAVFAIQNIVFSATGIFIFTSSGLEQYLVGYGNFRLLGSFLNRAGGFLLNPDWNGVFLATMLFVAMGLYLSSESSHARLLYLVEAALVLIALLFTFSTASWIATGVGVVALALLAGNRKATLHFLEAALAGAIGLLVLFPSVLGLLFQHASSTREVGVRLGLWQTALNISIARPWSGVGFGLSTYMARAEPYRSMLQYRPYPQPHESYLELSAMGGVPLLLVFLLVLGLVLRRAWLNYLSLRGKQRALLGGAIVGVLVFSVNALMINAWTVAPLVALIWFILGAISSPGLISGAATPTLDPPADGLSVTTESERS